MTVRSSEHERALCAIRDAARVADLAVYRWSIVRGISPFDTASVDQSTRDPAAALSWLIARTRRTVLVMEGILDHCETPAVVQLLRDVAANGRHTVAAIDPEGRVLRQVATDSSVFELPLPTRDQIADHVAQ